MPRRVKVPVLEGDAIRLRGLETSDAPRIVEYCQAPDTQRWTAVPRPYTLAHAEAFIAASQEQWDRPDGARAFAVEVPQHPGMLRGTIVLRPDSSGIADVRYALHPDAQGTDVAGDALKTVCRWWFDCGGVVVRWQAYVGNTASVAAARAAGFTLDGATRRHAASGHDGTPHDCYTGSLHRDDQVDARPQHTSAPTLTGDGLVLREWTEADEAFTEPEDHPAHFTPANSTATPKNFARWLASRRIATLRGNGLGWAITDASSGRVLGDVGLYGLKPGSHAELGYWLYPSARGRGLAVRAARLIADWALTAEVDGGLGLSRLTARYVEGNHASGRVLARAGFTPSGVTAATDRDESGESRGLVAMQRLAASQEHVLSPVVTTVATAADWRRVRALRVRALAEEAGSSAKRLEATLRLPDDAWKAPTGWSHHVLAVMDGLDVGIVKCAPREDDPQVWDLHGLWIDPTCCGSGVEQSLLRTAEEQAVARGAQRLSCDVTTADTTTL